MTTIFSTATSFNCPLACSTPNSRRALPASRHSTDDTKPGTLLEVCVASYAVNLSGRSVAGFWAPDTAVLRRAVARAVSPPVKNIRLGASEKNEPGADEDIGGFVGGVCGSKLSGTHVLQPSRRSAKCNTQLNSRVIIFLFVSFFSLLPCFRRGDIPILGWFHNSRLELSLIVGQSSSIGNSRQRRLDRKFPPNMQKRQHRRKGYLGDLAAASLPRVPGRAGSSVRGPDMRFILSNGYCPHMHNDPVDRSRMQIEFSLDLPRPNSGEINIW